MILQLQHAPDGPGAIVICRLKNLHVSHSSQGVTQAVNQCEALDFIKWSRGFLANY